eukprot:maker-scaffold455_size166772-snap-gene-0.39 protein:Tk12525 transcript:maker-scaffold455_size166772-snap-gene-0.39-mRNA-1 annotation:"hypothetical protein DAPPUDRAFT_110200"
MPNPEWWRRAVCSHFTGGTLQAGAICISHFETPRRGFLRRIFSRRCLGVMLTFYRWKHYLLLLVGISFFIYSISNGPPFEEIFYRKPLNRTGGPFEGYKNCNPETKVAFLKTHKCASTTVQNIFLRYAYQRDLNVVLPMTSNYVGRFRPFHRSALWGTPWEDAEMKYNFYCLHGIWNFEEVDALMGAGTKYVTILRDPVELFRSLWDYTGMSGSYKVSLEQFAFSNKTGPLSDRRFLKNLGQNQMLWDLGVPKPLLDDDTTILDKIQEVEQTFDLVMIAERFQESIILLKDLLCWDFKDVATLKLNGLKAGAKSKISDKARQALKEWLRADYVLYNHFAKKLNLEVAEYGQTKMENKLSTLSSVVTNVKDKCIEAKVTNDQLKDEFKLIGGGKNMLGYELKNTTDKFCETISLAEVKFIDRLRESQTGRANIILKAMNKSESDLSSMKKFRPRDFIINGKPDIEAMKRVFQSKTLP